MKFKSRDPLQSLLREALHAQRSDPTKAHKAPLVAQPDPGDLYQPSCWKPGKLIILIHVAEDGSKSLLGLFQEQFNTRASARRLIPPPAAVRAATQNLSALPHEEVRGSYWLQPQKFCFSKESPEELRALHARFNELMVQLS